MQLFNKTAENARPENGRAVRPAVVIESIKLNAELDVSVLLALEICRFSQNCGVVLKASAKTIAD